MEWALLDPKGLVGAEELRIIATATGLMLLVVVPVIVMTLVVAWRYRASNRNARYAPDWDRSVPIAAVCLAVPLVIVVTLGIISWRETHALDPYRSLNVTVAGRQEVPVEVQVLALDWKWLFVYPQYGIASVNELALPVETPVHFSITASSVMNVFFIPRLGTMVYAMPHMQTQLSLLASAEGTYDGLSANYSGAGFSDMKFKTLALSHAGFEAWVANVKGSPTRLDAPTLDRLLAPGIATVAHYGAIDGDVFGHVLVAEQVRPGLRLAIADRMCTARRD